MNVDMSAYNWLLGVALVVAAVVFVGTFLISVVGVFKR